MGCKRLTYNEFEPILKVAYSKNLTAKNSHVATFWNTKNLDVNYYPFGQLMPNRHGSTADYRYSVNGQEKVDEIAGEGNHTTAEFWEYDTRLGRRWNRDPVVKHPESPYACFANNPVWFSDPNGADSTKVGNTWYWKIEHGDDYAKISKRTGVSMDQLKDGNTQDPLKLESGTLLNLGAGKVHFVYEEKTPTIYTLTLEGLAVNPYNSTLNYNGSGSPQTAENRKYACPAGSCPSNSGLSCDEFPYASTQQGGAGAVTNCVPARENSIQGGCLSALYKTMGAGDEFTVVPVPRPQQSPLLEPVPVKKPVPLPRRILLPIPNTKPVGGSPFIIPFGPAGVLKAVDVVKSILYAL